MPDGDAGLREELGKRQPFDLVEQEAWLSLMRTASVLDEPFERLFKGHGLSVATYNVLRIIRGEESGAAERGEAVGAPGWGVACQTIGLRLVTRVPDVTRLVDRLERAGLVVRHRSGGDRRVVLVGLTEAGRAKLAALDEPVRALHRSQLAHVSREELSELNRILYKLRHTEPPTG